MIEDVLTPYLQELARYQRLGLDTAAREQCIGLLLGLWRFEHESTNEFKDWAPDAPLGFAGVVLDAWQQELPKGADVKTVKAFLKDELHGWGAQEL